MCKSQNTVLLHVDLPQKSIVKRGGRVKTQAMYWESVFVGRWEWFYILHVRVDPVDKVGGLGVHSGVAGLSAPFKVRIAFLS